MCACVLLRSLQVALELSKPLRSIAAGGMLLPASRSGPWGVQVMAVGGISTIILGFGSQIVTTNAISGADLVSSATPETVHQ